LNHTSNQFIVILTERKENKSPETRFMPQKSCAHITILPPNLVIGSTNHPPQRTQKYTPKRRQSTKISTKIQLPLPSVLASTIPNEFFLVSQSSPPCLHSNPLSGLQFLRTP